MAIEIKTPLLDKKINQITVGDGIKLYFIAGATIFAGKVLVSTVNHLVDDYKTFFIKEDK